MALPNPDRPVINTTIETIVEDIQENMSYLDGTIAKYKWVTFTRTTVEGSGSATVAGVGFQPSTVLLFAMTSAGFTKPSFSIGFYGSSVGNMNSCMYVKSYDTQSASRTRYWYMSTGQCVVAYISDSLLPYTIFTGAVASTNSDGFSFTWNKSGLGTDDFTVTVLAFCIK